jgi:hypothetical protein
MTSLHISFLSVADGLNRCGCEAAMATEEDCGQRRKIGGEMAVEQGVIGFRIRSPFKGRLGKEHIMARGIKP